MNDKTTNLEERPKGPTLEELSAEVETLKAQVAELLQERPQPFELRSTARCVYIHGRGWIET